MYSKKISAIVITLMLLAELSFSAALPDFAWAESETHYIAVASDRHNETTAVKEAMSGMPESVEYVCLAGDMSSFEHRERPKTDSGSEASSSTQTGKQEETQAVPASDTETGTQTEETGTGTEASKTTEPAAADAEGSLTAKPERRPRKQMPYNTSDVLNEVQEVFPELTSENVSIIYAGHDSNATDDAGIIKCADTSQLPSSDAADHPEISEGQSGLIYTGPDSAYYIYGVAYQDMMNAAAGEKAAQSFKAWVSDKDPEIPVVLIGHVPIHKIRKDNKGATYWNKALNFAATGAEAIAEGAKIIRDVVYLHGHNHSRESTEYYLAPGDKIHAEGDDEESDLYYTYITAGYLTSARTATLLAITKDDISFMKYTGVVGSTELSSPALLGEKRRVHYYTVSFSDGADAQDVLESNTASRPQDPVRSGYSFGGWYTDESFSNEFDFDSPVTSDMTLYAKWIAADADDEDVNNEAGGESAAESANGQKASGNSVAAYSADTVMTGDNSGIVLWCALMLTALAALIMIIAERFRIRDRS